MRMVSVFLVFRGNASVKHCWVSAGTCEREGVGGGGE